MSASRMGAQVVATVATTCRDMLAMTLVGVIGQVCFGVSADPEA